MLRVLIMTAFSQEIVGKISQEFKSPGQPFGWLSENNFIATTKNFKHFAPYGKFFWQSYCLAVS
jgi:hypothetical protein